MERSPSEVKQITSTALAVGLGATGGQRSVEKMWTIQRDILTQLLATETKIMRDQVLVERQKRFRRLSVVSGHDTEDGLVWKIEKLCASLRSKLRKWITTRLRYRRD